MRKYIFAVLLASAIGLQSSRALAQSASTDRQIFVRTNNASALSSVSSDLLYLAGGTAVLGTAKDVVIVAGEQKLIIGAGTIVALDLENDVFKCRNLWDSRRGKVTIMANSRTYKLNPGEEFVSASNFESLENTTSLDNVARRSLQTEETADGSNILTCEFSIPSLLASEVCLHRLYRSVSEPDKRVISKVLKMSALLEIVTTRHGAYKFLDRDPSG